MKKNYRPAIITTKNEKATGTRRPVVRPPKQRRRKSRRGRPSSNVLFLIILACLAVVAMQIIWVNRNEDKFSAPIVQQLFRQLYNAQQLPIQCHLCEGSGNIEAEDGVAILCPVCFGVGRHHVRITQEEDVLCPTCGAMGRVYNAETHETHLCPRCAGRGLIKGNDVEALEGGPVRLLQIECDICEGNGRIRDPRLNRSVVCPVCFGLGYRWARKVKPHEAICPACGGMGFVYDRDTRTADSCPRCDGRGIIAGSTNTTRISE